MRRFRKCVHKTYPNTKKKLLNIQIKLYYLIQLFYGFVCFQVSRKVKIARGSETRIQARFQMLLTYTGLLTNLKLYRES